MGESQTVTSMAPEGAPVSGLNPPTHSSSFYEFESFVELFQPNAGVGYLSNGGIMRVRISPWSVQPIIRVYSIVILYIWLYSTVLTMGASSIT